MTITWKIDAQYKVFLSSSLERLNIVSSHLCDDANTILIGRNSLFAVDNDTCFCDCELMADTLTYRRFIDDRNSIIKARDDVKVEVDLESVVRLFIDKRASRAIVEVSDKTVTTWVQLSQNIVCLGLSNNDLVAISVKFFEDDNGQYEAQWLREIGLF